MIESTAPATAPDARPRVLVGVDGSPGSRPALREALLEAGRRGSRLDVVAAYPVLIGWTGCVPLAVPDAPALREDTATDAQELLDQVRAELLVEDARGLDRVAVELAVVGGPAEQVLVHRAVGADLLVVGNRGRGAVRSAVLGSVALHCATHAPCPVVVVHEPSDARRALPLPVVVGVDGSPASAAALREAVTQARYRGTDVEAVAAYSLDDQWTDVLSVLAPAPERIRRRVAQAAEQVVAAVTAEEESAGHRVPPVRVHPVDGQPTPVLLRYAEGGAVLVVGSSGHGTARGLLLGSVALHCALHAHRPVVVVHPEDRPAPVLRAPETAAAPS